MVYGRRLLLLLVFLLPGFVSAQLIAPNTDLPTYEMVVERRRFVNEDATTPTLTRAQLAHLRAQGWSAPRTDETGFDYIMRRSVRQFRPTTSGDLVMREFAYLDGAMTQAAERDPLHIPLATDPHRAENLMMSLHPLALVMPDFTEILALHFPDAEESTAPGGRKQVLTNDWVYIYTEDQEHGATADIAQYHRETGMLVKRTVYQDWYTAESGRYIPRHVYVRTYRGTDENPVVEMRFLNIKEAPLPRKASPTIP